VAEQSIPLFGDICLLDLPRLPARWPNDLQARAGWLYALAVVAHQAGRKSCSGSASRPQKITSKGTVFLNARLLKTTPVFG
jgi:hypothetical protein